MGKTVTHVRLFGQENADGDNKKMRFADRGFTAEVNLIRVGLIRLNCLRKKKKLRLSKVPEGFCQRR